jgi:molecular chaperone HscA
LQADSSLLTSQEKESIEKAVASLEQRLPGKDHRPIKKAIEALNHATEEFAGRRMDAGVKRALAGQKIESL